MIYTYFMSESNAESKSRAGIHGSLGRVGLESIEQYNSGPWDSIRGREVPSRTQSRDLDTAGKIKNLWPT